MGQSLCSQKNTIISSSAKNCDKIRAQNPHRITAFFTPGFQINNVWALAIAAIVLTIMDYLIVRFTGLHASPFGKGFVGFALAAIILYVTQFFVAGYTISWMAAIIGALIYGVIDYFIPGNQSM